MARKWEAFSRPESQGRRATPPPGPARRARMAHSRWPAPLWPSRQRPLRRRLKVERGRGMLAKEKPPIFGLLQRGFEVVIRMPENASR
jgi:hypothetical protein